MFLHPVGKRESALFFLLASVFPTGFSLQRFISKKLKNDPSAPIGSFTPVRAEVIFCSRKDLKKKKLFIFS